MFKTFMINWSGQAIPAAEMAVMRRVAVAVRTVLQVAEVEFVHDICSGIVRYEKTGMYGATGGLFFFGDFGAKNNQPNTVDFFIPRSMLHVSADAGVVISRLQSRSGNTYASDDYPEDVCGDVANGLGKLKITVRKES